MGVRLFALFEVLGEVNLVLLSLELLYDAALPVHRSGVLPWVVIIRRNVVNGNQLLVKLAQFTMEHHPDFSSYLTFLNYYFLRLYYNCRCIEHALLDLEL